jgi:lysozyme
MTEPHGIDVAWPQGARYNWAQWAGKIGFGMCKATEGATLIDPDFAGNWVAMLEMDRVMPRFAYHFFHAADDPIAQARHFVSTVQGAELLAGDNFVADFEATSGLLNDGVPSAEFAERGVAFLHEVNALAPGHRVLPYMNPSFARAGNSAGMGAWYLWVADYGVLSPDVPPPWTTWTFWQTGSDPQDTDVFGGNEAELLAFCRMPQER